MATSEITDADAGVDEILSEVQADDYYAIVPEWVLFHAESPAELAALGE